MRTRTLAVSVVSLSAVLGGACRTTRRTVIVGPNPEMQSGAAAGNRSTAATLGIPPGHLPGPGECRIWIPGTPPGRQPKPKSRPCPGIAAFAPAGSWIVYRPGDNLKVVHVREVDAQRAGIVIRTRIFDIETTRLLREEAP